MLSLWEDLHLPYVVVAQLSQPIQRLLRGDLLWTQTKVPGTEVAELMYQGLHWPQGRAPVPPVASTRLDPPRFASKISCAGCALSNEWNFSTRLQISVPTRAFIHKPHNIVDRKQYVEE